MKKSEISIIGGLFLALAISFFTDNNFQADNIRKQTLRLHVIAQDDSAYSQQVKTQVKDVIVNTAASLYCRAENYHEAVRITQDNLEYLQQIADNTLENLGAGYKSQCSIEQFYFDTTEYEDFTMPRGVYTALTVRLGDAQGKNWWCVVYPPLCAAPMESVAAFDEEEWRLISEDGTSYEIRFRLLELWGELTGRFSS